MLRDLKAVGANVIPNGIGVHSLTALDGIERLITDNRRCTQEHHRYVRYRNAAFLCSFPHDQSVQNAKSSLGPISTSYRHTNPLAEAASRD